MEDVEDFECTDRETHDKIGFKNTDGGCYEK